MTNLGPDSYVLVDCQGLVNTVLKSSTGKNFSPHGVGHWRRERVTVRGGVSAERCPRAGPDSTFGLWLSGYRYASEQESSA